MSELLTRTADWYEHELPAAPRRESLIALLREAADEIDKCHKLLELAGIRYYDV